MPRAFRCVLFPTWMILAAGVLVSASAAPPERPTAEQLDFFEKKIRPVLVEHCYQCHSAEAEQVEGGLRLDTRAGIRQGGESGAAVVPGKPDSSLLLDAIRYESFEMPPDRKLPAEVVADFERWISQGAADPRDGAAPALAATMMDIEQGKQFWAFQPPERSAPPVVQQTDWPRQPIDWFILKRLEEAGLSPSPPAGRRTLIRRVSFDLTGLPPTPEEVEAFVNDPSPRAYENLVDRLLASPHYGERWARMWLDLARYAEDQAHIVGSNKSLFYPNAYRYRDWLIGALNEDIPYDRFVTLQLAVDLLEPENSADLAALGFIGLGPKYYRRGDLAVMADEWEDRVDTVTRSLLGLTVACARCHDHKYDPIPTEDYYALAGVFASTEMFNRPLNEDCETKKNGHAEDPEDALHIIRDTKPTDLNIFIRGDVTSKGPVVKRHFLHVLSDGEPEPFTNGSGRLELAEAIVDRGNPLTARVIVNRIWAQNFGRPLVATPSNFGNLGERPTHPDLLDDLAVRFMEAGWSLKWLQREMVLSAAYRQTSRPSADHMLVDPANKLLGHMNRRRLSVEQWRDGLLAASGQLEPAVGGPSIDPQDPDEGRRTIYSDISRLDLNPMLALFDFPDPNVHAGRRVQTTTPLQKLFVLNNPFMVRQAEALAVRLKTEVDTEGQDIDRRRIERAYRLLFGRFPTNEEIALGLEFLHQVDTERAGPWEQYSHVLLASNEMLFLD